MKAFTSNSIMLLKGEGSVSVFFMNIQKNYHTNYYYSNMVMLLDTVQSSAFLHTGIVLQNWKKAYLTNPVLASKSNHI